MRTDLGFSSQFSVVPFIFCFFFRSPFFCYLQTASETLESCQALPLSLYLWVGRWTDVGRARTGLRGSRARFESESNPRLSLTFLILAPLADSGFQRDSLRINRVSTISRETKRSSLYKKKKINESSPTIFTKTIHKKAEYSIQRVDTHGTFTPSVITWTLVRDLSLFDTNFE